MLLDDIYASEIGRTNARRLFNWKMIEGTFAKKIEGTLVEWLMELLFIQRI
jgi:hypothetical protein